MIGENRTPYGILALWVVNGLSIVYGCVNDSQISGHNASDAMAVTCQTWMTFVYSITIVFAPLLIVLPVDRYFRF